mgnify:CR=1 FL=1
MEDAKNKMVTQTRASQPTHSCCFLCDFVFAVEIASRLPALNFAVQFPDVM